MHDNKKKTVSLIYLFIYLSQLKFVYCILNILFSCKKTATFLTISLAANHLISISETSLLNQLEYKTNTDNALVHDPAVHILHLEMAFVSSKWSRSLENKVEWLLCSSVCSFLLTMVNYAAYSAGVHVMSSCIPWTLKHWGFEIWHIVLLKEAGQLLELLIICLSGFNCNAVNNAVFVEIVRMISHYP